MSLKSTLQTGTSLFLIINSQIVLKSHHLLLTLNTLVCQYGSEITLKRKKAGGKGGNTTFVRCFHFTDIKYEQSFLSNVSD